eukprot:COSAG04_NODE_451_length_14146_cov_611.491920_26_plen_108_part_01
MPCRVGLAVEACFGYFLALLWTGGVGVSNLEGCRGFGHKGGRGRKRQPHLLRIAHPPHRIRKAIELIMNHCSMRDPPGEAAAGLAHSHIALDWRCATNTDPFATDVHS